MHFRVCIDDNKMVIVVKHSHLHSSNPIYISISRAILTVNLSLVVRMKFHEIYNRKVFMFNRVDKSHAHTHTHTPQLFWLWLIQSTSSWDYFFFVIPSLWLWRRHRFFRCVSVLSHSLLWLFEWEFVYFRLFSLYFSISFFISSSIRCNPLLTQKPNEQKKNLHLKQTTTTRKNRFNSLTLSIHWNIQSNFLFFALRFFALLLSSTNTFTSESKNCTLEKWDEEEETKNFPTQHYSVLK